MLCDVSCGDVTSSCDVSCGVVLCGDDIVWCGEVRTGTGLARRRALFKTRTHHLGSGGIFFLFEKPPLKMFLSSLNLFFFV